MLVVIKGNKETLVDQHCKKQSVHTTLIGIIYDTVGVLIILIVEEVFI